MSDYLLDTNVVIGLWKEHPFVIDTLIKNKRIKILKEVSQELAIKETRRYKGQHVLSERFLNLITFIIEIDSDKIKEFYAMLNIKYSTKGNAYYNANKLSETDLFLLYACYLDNKLVLVTEDKYLFNAANYILGDERVINLNTLVEKYKAHEN